MTYVIAGAGPAGVIAAETLRQMDGQSPIIMINDEREPPYSRMALPYLLAENIAEEGTYLRRTPGHFENRKIDLQEGRLSRVNPDNKLVTMEDGASLAYDKLLIATGSQAIRPPIPGIDLPGVENCWSLGDARKIAAKATAGTDVVLMGAGFIGCIVLEALAERGVNLTVVEMEDRMVPRMMNKTGGDMIKSWCKKKGVRVLTSTRVEGVEQSGDTLKLSLANGDDISAHLVVCATGVRPNVRFLEGSGVACETGILVDEHLKTNRDNVYAAGDVAEGFDFSTGVHQIHAIQPTAADHGRIAAQNMAGKPTPFTGSLSMNVLNTLGLISSSFGQWMGVDGGEMAELVDHDRYRYICLSFADDVLVGALALGLTQHVGVLRGLIQTRVALGHWKDRLKENPLRIMDAYLARTQGSSFGF